MKTYVYGDPQHITKEELKDAAEWASSFLLHPRISNRIRINIIVNHDKSGKNTLSDNMYAKVTTIDKETRGNKKPSTFRIIIDGKLKHQIFMEAFFHEMVHVKQWSTGQLSIVRGQYYNFDKTLYHHTYRYWMRPWELEAFGMGVAMYGMYMDDMKATLTANADAL